MTPASIMMGVSRIETSWAPPPAIVGESGAEEKAKFFFPSIDNSQSEKKKKECPRVSRGKERRTKQKQKQASKQEKKTPLSLSFSLLTVEKKKQAKQAEKKRRAASLHPSSSNLSQSLSTKMRFALLFLALCVAVLASMVRPLEAIVGFGCARARILFSLFSL